MVRLGSVRFVFPGRHRQSCASSLQAVVVSDADRGNWKHVASCSQPITFVGVRHADASAAFTRKHWRKSGNVLSPAIKCFLTETVFTQQRMFNAFLNSLDRNIDSQPTVFQIAKTNLNWCSSSQFVRQRPNTAPSYLGTGIGYRVLSLDNLYQDRFLILFLRVENSFGSHRQTRVAWNQCRGTGPAGFSIGSGNTKAMRIDIGNLETRRLPRMPGQQNTSIQSRYRNSIV